MGDGGSIFYGEDDHFHEQKQQKNELHRGHGTFLLSLRVLQAPPGIGVGGQGDGDS